MEIVKYKFNIPKSVVVSPKVPFSNHRSGELAMPMSLHLSAGPRQEGGRWTH